MAGVDRMPVLNKPGHPNSESSRQPEYWISYAALDGTGSGSAAGESSSILPLPHQLRINKRRAVARIWSIANMAPVVVKRAGADERV